MNSVSKSSSDSELNILNPKYKDYKCRRQRSNSAKAYLLEDFSRRASLENDSNNPVAKLSINNIKSFFPPILRGQKEGDSQVQDETMDDGTVQPTGNKNVVEKSQESHQDANTDIFANDVAEVKPSKSASNCTVRFQEDFGDDQNHSKSATESCSHPEDDIFFLGGKRVEPSKPTLKNQICIPENSKSDAKPNVPVINYKEQITIAGISNEDTLDEEKERFFKSKDAPCLHGSSNAEISSPYQIFEETCNQVNLNDSIFGQPRCLTVKQSDASTRSTRENGKKTRTASGSIFSEDSEKETNTKHARGGSLTSDHERNRVTDREEGELTPDHLSSAHSDGKNSEKLKLKESTTEFLSKINQCFLQLEEEFTDMHIPKNSTRLKEHLQRTLRIVEGMKRKLSFLIHSSNSREDKDRTHSAAGDRRDLKSSQKTDQSDRRNRYQHSVQRKSYRSSTSGREFQSRHELHKRISQPTSKFEGKDGKDKQALNSTTSASKDQERSVKEELKIGSHSYGRKEKLRIKSLFKRQMNIITQQIQKRESKINQQSKSGDFGETLRNKLMQYGISTKLEASDISQKIEALEQLKTLDDMENFLLYLKEKQPAKKKILKFTTKKPKLRIREATKFLTEAKADKNNRTVSTSQKAVPGQNENKSRKVEREDKNLEEIGQREKVVRKEKSNGEPLVEYNQSRHPNSVGTPKADLSRLRKSKEQNKKRRKEKISDVAEENLGHRIGFLETEENAKGVIDSLPVERNSKEMELIKLSSLPKDSGFKAYSHKMTAKNTEKRKRREYSSPESSASDRSAHRELKDQMSSKKRKRSEAGHELSFTEPEKEITSKRKSRAEYRLDSEEEIDYFPEERLSEELKPREMFIVANENTKALLDKYFRFKVIGNQIYLQTTATGEIGGNKCKKKEQKNSDFKSQEWEEAGDEEIPERKKRLKKTDRSETHFDSKNAETTLKEMEDFLQKLRAKKKVSDGELPYEMPSFNPQSPELKFMARIHAKRKAKLMACMSETPVITEKEAKFLKDLERRAVEPGDSPSTEKKKQKLMQKIRAETDAIVLAQKERYQKPTSSEDDPLQDVKKILNMIRKAESGDAGNKKEFYVSFPLKRSDVKKLENITEGRTSALSEESQRFLNNVRAKMRAKKTTLPN